MISHDGAMNDKLYIGLMSGTSADGIDAALVRFAGGADIDGGCAPLRAEVVAARTSPWDPDVRARLVWLGQAGRRAPVSSSASL